MKKIMTVPEQFKAHLKKTMEEQPDLNLGDALRATIAKSPGLFSWDLAARAMKMSESHIKNLNRRV